MKNISNLYIEKKTGFTNESEALDRDILEMLKIKVQSRIINAYEILGLVSEEVEVVKYTVFGDIAQDLVHLDESSWQDQPYFILELLPGQYDVRAEAARECIRLVLGNFEAEVRCKKVYVFSHVSHEELMKIREYLLNPVEMRVGTLHEGFEEFPLKETKVELLDGFLHLDDEKRLGFLREHSLAMKPEDLKLVQDYFIGEKRDPSITEIRVLDTYWSDHCRHTTFNTHLKDIRIPEDDEMLQSAYAEYLRMREKLGRKDKPVTLMDLATIGTRYLKKAGLVTDLDESPEINACSISRKVRTDEGIKDVLIMFKNETHNHPTEIEPFGGAATCLGGAIRDPLSGRAYVYQGMRISGSGDPRASLENTRKGKLPQRVITKGAAKGFSSYGNQIGLNTGFVEEIYHPGFEAKRMETGAVIASTLKENVIREVPEPGDVIILLGGRTGRDGIGGATGSSKGHHAGSIQESGAEVQKGNAVEERKLQRFFRNEKAVALIRRCNDFGAGGVSVAMGELADSLDISLDLVPKKYLGLDPTEIAISESQERMAVVIKAKDMDQFIRYASLENLEATKVATVTDTGRLRMFYEDQIVVDLHRDFINTNGAVSETDVEVSPAEYAGDEEMRGLTLLDLREEICHLDFSSQKGLLENFDTTIGAGSLILPYGGIHQNTKSQGMVSLIPLKNLKTYDASIMTYGYEPLSMEENPFIGANDAVVESLAKVLSLGGNPLEARLSFQEYFRKLGEDPRNWGRPFSALLGALKAQMDYKVPAIGGKDSMSGTFQDIHVPDTLISFAVTTIPEEKVMDNVLKGEGSLLLTLRTPRINRLYDPLVFEENSRFIQKLRDTGAILSMDTLKNGLFKSIFNMAAGSGTGFSLESITSEENKKDPGSFILEVPKQNVDEVMKSGRHLLLKIIGAVEKDASVHLGDLALPLIDLLNDQRRALQPVFNEYLKEGQRLETRLCTLMPEKYPEYIEHPKVLIPVFFGTNCEYDLEFAFRKEGAEVTSFIFRNQPENIRESLEEFSRLIRETNILMLSGGFSAGDEPEGSGKYIANVLRNPLIRDAVHELTEERKGLILGICNGFQGLVKSGLLPYGKIIKPHEAMPVLTYNTAGKHMSRMVKTKVISRNTPWMENATLGEVYDVPVSHGEGRFMATEEVLHELRKHGQIITQFADLSGEVTMEGPYNPNGSLWAIEGIASRDGRIFGKMGHSERYQKGLYRNYPGKYYEDLFKSGVDYFRNVKYADHKE